MAPGAPAADQATDLLQNLSLDPKKNADVPEVPKKDSVVSMEAPIMPFPTSNRSGTPTLHDFVDPSVWYPSAYYYGGYDGSIGEWEDYSRYMSPEIPTHGGYGDVYNHNYSYAPYSPYPSPASPVPTVGHDGQFYGTQNYQYPQYYPLPATPAAPIVPNQHSNSQPEASTAISGDNPVVAAEKSKAKANGAADGKSGGNSAAFQSRNNLQSPSLSSTGSYARGAVFPGYPSSSYQGAHYGFDGMQSSLPWYDGAALYDGKYRHTSPVSGSYMTSHIGGNSSTRNQNNQPLPNLLGRPGSSVARVAPSLVNRMYPNNQSYGQYGTAHRMGFGYGSSGYDTRTNARWSDVTDSKFKPRGGGYGFFNAYGYENLDGLGEMNKGPRINRSKNLKDLGSTVTIATKGQSLASSGSVEDNVLVPTIDQYNKEDFPENYSDAKFFIIKSYSEDDVHKSVKYNVWASTPNGNKKLDAVYKEAQEKPDDCPVFLFFSVNTSGQFVGVAEMVGPVDFDKTVIYWQQDKWNGCFPVKWHIVKDVPNSILKHIILDNNDGKPVTNSRDTQEVKLEQGLQMLKLFKEHISKTCLLDDFGFYENRQKVILERRAQQMQKQTFNTRASDAAEDKGAIEKNKLPRPLEVVSILKKEPPPVIVQEPKIPDQSDSAAAAGVASPNLSNTPASENPVTENGVANGSS